jgi:primosomal protein N' (replication factor Y)
METMNSRKTHRERDTRFVDVAFPRPVRTEFTYAVPQDLQPFVRRGTRVRAALSGQVLAGVVVAVGVVPDPAHRRIAPLAGVIDPEIVVPSELLELTRWVAEYYMCSWGEALGAASGGTLPSGEMAYRRQQLDWSSADSAVVGLTPTERRVLGQLAASKSTKQSELLRRGLNRRSLYGAIKRLQERGLVRAEWKARHPAIPREAVVIGLDLARRAEVSPETERYFIDNAATLSGKRWSTVADGCPGGRSRLRVLMHDEVITWEPLPATGGRFGGTAVAAEPGTERLHDDQKQACEHIRRLLDQRKPHNVLLWGPTGSGKTAVYCDAIRHAWSLGRSVLFLVPEISLAPPMIARLEATLGGPIGVWHSGLTGSQRYWIARKVAQGRYRILVGARSAIFAPIPDCGLIIVDEEHSESYKQSDPAPRYHARDVAAVRARLSDAVCVLGSATPSCESYHNAISEKYALLRLVRRPAGRVMPLVRVVDLAKRRRTEEHSWITPRLGEALVATIRNGRKAIVFLNRRGYATMVVCRDCGHYASCPDCRLTLTYHAKDQTFRCHICANAQPAWETCPKCRGTDFFLRGVGTQRIEEHLAALDNAIRLARLDADVAAQRGAAEEILSGFAGDKYNLLIGTQMVSKGLDVARVGLVGVIWADQHMAFPDFRAEEKTFQLLTQVAGRAGRGDSRLGLGEVIVQTFQPDHELIELAAGQNAELFFQRELPRRQSLDYPPFSHLVLLSFTAGDAAAARRAARDFSEYWSVESRKSAGAPGRLLGPAPAAIPQREGRYSVHVLIKSRATKKVRQIIDSFREAMETQYRRQEISVIIDVDPSDFR